MISVDDTVKAKKLGAAPFILGGLSFIPLIGAVFGVICIIWGIAARQYGGKKLASIGFAGIAFTFAFYGALFYFGVMQRGGIYDALSTQMAQSNINSLVPAIEMYKTRLGKYPESLNDIKDVLARETFISTYDPSSTKMGIPQEFYYEKIDDDHYYLLGVGPDGVPFTDDDLIPNIPAFPRGNVGLMAAHASQP